MNVAVPAAPSGSRAPHGSGDKVHARDKASAGDFAAALFETASERGEEGADAGAIAKSLKGLHKTAKLPGRIDGKDGATAASKEDAASMAETLAELGGAETRALAEAKVGEATEAATAGALDAQAAAAPPPADVPGDAPAGRDVHHVRDALTALAIETPAQPGKTATLDDIVARLGKHLPVGARTAIEEAGDAAFVGDGQPADLEFIAGLSDEVLASAKVVRQETHFQPVGQDVRRLPSMSPIANDDRLMEISLAAAEQAGRQGAGSRDRQDAPTLTMRPVEAMAAANVAATSGEPMPGSIGQQIADGVQRALAAPAPSQPATAQPAPAAAPSSAMAFAPAVRTIKLQLNPLSLGTVTVMITGRDAELSIKLEAELAETVGRVEQDRNVLSARLAGAGYAVGEITVGRMGSAAAPGAESDARDSGARAGNQPQGEGGRGREDGAAPFAEERAGRQGETWPLAGEGTRRLAAKGGAVAHPVAGISYSGRFRPV